MGQECCLSLSNKCLVYRPCHQDIWLLLCFYRLQFKIVTLFLGGERVIGEIPMYDIFHMAILTYTVYIVQCWIRI